MATFIGLSACSQGVTTGTSTSTAIVAPPTTSSATIPSGDAAIFDVHEWGLVDVAGAQARVLAGPPAGATNWNAPRRKPVLYFHLADGTSDVDVSVTIQVAPPGIVEHFPVGVLGTDPTELTWSGLRLRTGHCPVGEVPAREAPGCKTADGICEAAELKTYETSDATCIHTSAGDFNHLFYRATGPAPTLPFDVTPKDGALVVAHARAADVVGSILWVHNEAGAVTVSIIAPPAVGGHIEVSPPKDTDVTSAQAALDASMRDTGLTDAEIQAFDRAWANDLFGRNAARDAPARRGLPGPQDYLLFALPQSMMGGASEVTITPAPRTLKRFMLVRLAV